MFVFGAWESVSAKVIGSRGLPVMGTRAKMKLNFGGLSCTWDKDKHVWKRVLLLLVLEGSERRSCCFAPTQEIPSIDNTSLTVLWFRTPPIWRLSCLFSPSPSSLLPLPSPSLPLSLYTYTNTSPLYTYIPTVLSGYVHQKGRYGIVIL